jgi:hypothetical protein
VAKWLSILPQSSSVRNATFLIAFDASETCEDRAALALSHMWAAGFVSQVEKGVYDNDIPEFIGRARLIFRLEMLARKASEKVSEVRQRGEEREVDEISIYLGYEVKLNGDLQLKLPIRSMRFFSGDLISAEDLLTAQFSVMQNENEEFAVWLSMWSPWEGILQRQDGVGYEKMQKDLHRKGERKFKNQLAKAIRDFGAGNDEEVKQFVGPRIMTRIEWGIKLPFTRDFLKSRNYLGLLDPFWCNVEALRKASKKQAKIAERLNR